MVATPRRESKHLKDTASTLPIGRAKRVSSGYFFVVPIPLGPSPTVAAGIGVPAVSVPSALMVKRDTWSDTVSAVNRICPFGWIKIKLGSVPVAGRGDVCSGLGPQSRIHAKYADRIGVDIRCVQSLPVRMYGHGMRPASIWLGIERVRRRNWRQ